MKSKNSITEAYQNQQIDEGAILTKEFIDFDIGKNEEIIKLGVLFDSILNNEEEIESIDLQIDDIENNALKYTLESEEIQHIFGKCHLMSML